MVVDWTSNLETNGRKTNILNTINYRTSKFKVTTIVFLIYLVIGQVILRLQQ